jgi:hypothetical protein
VIITLTFSHVVDEAAFCCCAAAMTEFYADVLRVQQRAFAVVKNPSAYFFVNPGIN